MPLPTRIQIAIQSPTRSPAPRNRTPQPAVEGDTVLRRLAAVHAATRVQSRRHPVVVVDVTNHARLPHLRGVVLPEEQGTTRGPHHLRPVDV